MHTLRPKRALAIQPLQSLEERALLSTVSLNPATVAAQEALVATKGGQDLGVIYQQYVSFEQAGGQGTFTSTEANRVSIKGTTVGVDVHVKGNFSSDEKQLQTLGMQVTATSPKNGTVEGYVPIAQLPTVAASSFDVGISPIFKPITKVKATPKVTKAPAVVPIRVIAPRTPTPVSTTTPTVTPTIAATPAASPSPSVTIVAAKGGPALASIYQEYLNYEQAGAKGAFNPPEASQIIIKGTSVGVDIRVTGNLAASVALFQNLGMQVTSTAVAGQVGIIEGELPIFQLPTVAGDASVVGLGPIYKPTLR